MTAAELEALLRQAFADADVRVTDQTGTGDHFRVEVTSPSFAGLSTLDRHRRIHAAVGERLTREIHALEIHARVP